MIYWPVTLYVECMEEVHARRPNPYFTWCGLDTGEALSTCWAHQVTCDECRDLIVEALPARSIFFMDPLFDSDAWASQPFTGGPAYDLRTTREV